MDLKYNLESPADVSAGKPHPLGVKPSGNAFSIAVANQRYKLMRRARSENRDGSGSGHDASADNEGERVLTLANAVGPRLACVGEALVLRVLGMLDARSLAALGCVSHASFVYTSFDDLWRELMLAQLERADNRNMRLRFLGTWKASMLGGGQKGNSVPVSRTFVPRGSVCSDTLFRPWQYATADISSKWTSRQVVEMRKAASLSVDQFVEEFEQPGIPVLITGALHWPVTKLWGDQVDPARPQRPVMNVRADHAMSLFRVGPVDMPLCDFLTYAEQQQEELPLYLFDCNFVERILGTTAKDSDCVLDSSPLYRTPPYFRNSESHPHRDLFECMGRRHRPDFRWLIAGAAKSGSKWHIDPNLTHAWNGVVSGSKRWLMFPPNHNPPGVTPSEDGGEVTQPVSLLEWFVNFYHIEKAPVEFTARAGDLVFVPSGWWHCVLNLESCVAITQNYISDTNLAQGLAFMHDSPDNVSGLSEGRSRETLWKDFRDSLQKYAPALLERVDADEEQKRKREDEKRKRRIDSTTEPGFTFSFF